MLKVKLAFEAKSDYGYHSRLFGTVHDNTVFNWEAIYMTCIHLPKHQLKSSLVHATPAHHTG